MKSQARKQVIAWGGLLIFLGVAPLVEMFTDLSSGVGAAILIAAGFFGFSVYLTDRSQLSLLVPAYMSWALAGLIGLVTSYDLPDESVATYVLTVMALPFLVVFLRNRDRWWALIPPYVSWAVVGLVWLTTLNNVLDESIVAYVLPAISLPFLVVFLHNRDQWWALILPYFFLIVLATVGLVGRGILSRDLIRAPFLVAIAIPFFVAYARNPKRSWVLIPGGIIVVIGLAFLVAVGDSLIQYVCPQC